MIREIEGDILLSKAALIVHGVAPNDHFNQGLALSIREMWPSLYKDFRHYVQTQGAEPGGVWMWHGAEGRHIASLFTQEGSNDHGSKPGAATLEHVNHCLRQLKKVIEHEKYSSVALPKLATGVGKLNWKDVRPLIENQLGGLGIPVLLYTTFRKGVAGSENL